MSQLHIVVVCGYGCHLVPELQGYLDRVAEFAIRHRPDCFIFCGGFTQRKSAPGVSEARMMREYIIPKLIQANFRNFREYLEDDSYTTLDNIERAAMKIQGMEWLWLSGQDMKLTVFCEATRALKVDYLVRHFVGQRPNLETASWELMPPWKQIVSTLCECAAAKCPPLARYYRNKRIRRAERI